MKKLFFWVALIVFSFAVCGSAAQASPFTAPKKLADYLYYMEYTDYVPDLTTGEQVKTGFACSAEVDKLSEAQLLSLPNMTFDGINENGVAMNSNVVPAPDLDFATLLSTNYSKPRINVVRCVLDYAKSAAHGVELLNNNDTDNIMTNFYVNYAPNTPYAKHIARQGRR